MIQYRFTIPGRPRGKARPRFTKDGRVYTDQKTSDYEGLTKIVFRNHGGGMIPEGWYIRVGIVARYKIPDSASKADKEKMLNRRYMVTVKPDVDNIAKIILDALNGEAWRDDKEVTTLVVKKMYSTMGNSVEVEITGIDPEELENER